MTEFITTYPSKPSIQSFVRGAENSFVYSSANILPPCSRGVLSQQALPSILYSSESLDYLPSIDHGIGSSSFS